MLLGKDWDSPELSDPIYSGWSRRFYVDCKAVANRVITLIVYAPNEADANGYPVTFPLELVAGEYEMMSLSLNRWDGTTKSVTT